MLTISSWTNLPLCMFVGEVIKMLGLVFFNWVVCLLAIELKKLFISLEYNFLN